MAIVNARVDDRLIHGQVATSWIRGLQVQVIVVVDDRIAQDDTQKSILKMSAPASTKVYALGVDKFLEKMNQGILDDYQVMLIFDNIAAPLALVEKGFPLKTLNLGGIRYKEGRRQISKALSVSPEEENMIRKLHELGVEVEHRMLLTDQKANVIDLI